MLSIGVWNRARFDAGSSPSPIRLGHSGRRLVEDMYPDSIVEDKKKKNKTIKTLLILYTRRNEKYKR